MDEETDLEGQKRIAQGHKGGMEHSELLTPFLGAVSAILCCLPDP